MEYRLARAAAVHTIEYQAMQMNVEIGGGAEALDEGDCAGVSFAAFESRLLTRKVAMTRWMICNSGESSSGWAANRMRGLLGAAEKHRSAAAGPRRL
jgi:hypothetical protein